MKTSAKKSGGLWKIIRNGRVYLRLFTHPDTPWSAKALLLCAVVYVILPFDLIPDWVLGFGIVDDLAIGSLLIGVAIKIIEKAHKNNEEQEFDGKE